MWRYDYIPFIEFNLIILMWTQHRINTEKLYKKNHKRKKNNTGGRRQQPWNRLYLSYRKLLQVKKIYKIFSFCRQIINTKLLKGNQLLDITPEHLC